MSGDYISYFDSVSYVLIDKKKINKNSIYPNQSGFWTGNLLHTKFTNYSMMAKQQSRTFS